MIVGYCMLQGGESFSRFNNEKALAPSPAGASAVSKGFRTIGLGSRALGSGSVRVYGLSLGSRAFWGLGLVRGYDLQVNGWRLRPRMSMCMEYGRLPKVMVVLERTQSDKDFGNLPCIRRYIYVHIHIYVYVHTHFMYIYKEIDKYPRSALSF